MTLALIMIALWVAPYFILGEGAHLRVHDNLDSNIAWYKVLKESGQLFGPLDANIPQIMNGELSRNAFYSEFYGIVILFSLFPPMIAYGLSQTITRFFAFLGMYLLLKKHVLNDDKWEIIRVGAALTFALTPFWPSGMLNTLGMPLALWAFLNIRQGEKSWKNVLTLTLLPFYSSFLLGFFFFLSAMGIFWLIDLIRTKNWNPRFFFSIVYMTAIYLLIEYRQVYALLLPHEPTSRSEYFAPKLEFVHSLRLAVKNYVFGHNHDMTVHTLVILPITFIALFIVLINKTWRKEKLFIGLHVLNLLLSVWYAFWFYEGWAPLAKRFDILVLFNFARYHFLRPLVIYVLFALSLVIIWKLGKRWQWVAIAAMIAQIAVLVPFHEQIAYRNQPSFQAFYAEEQFSDIKEYIGLPVDQYRVVSIGIHPAIAQYNGFYTLDSYNNFYPLTYKHQFRKIIAPELEKNKTLKEYFDGWG